MNTEKTANTLRVYAGFVRRFQDFCSANRYCELPADSAAVRRFVEQLAAQRLSPSTVGAALSALHWLHAEAGLPDPTTALRPSLWWAYGQHRRRQGSASKKAPTE